MAFSLRSLGDLSLLSKEQKGNIQIGVQYCAFPHSLFQALTQWGRSKKRAGDKQGLVEKKLVADPACRPTAFSSDRPH